MRIAANRLVLISGAEIGCLLAVAVAHGVFDSFEETVCNIRCYARFFSDLPQCGLHFRFARIQYALWAGRNGRPAPRPEHNAGCRRFWYILSDRIWKCKDLYLYYINEMPTPQEACRNILKPEYGFRGGSLETTDWSGSYTCIANHLLLEPDSGFCVRYVIAQKCKRMSSPRHGISRRSTRSSGMSQTKSGHLQKAKSQYHRKSSQQ